MTHSRSPSSTIRSTEHPPPPSRPRSPRTQAAGGPQGEDRAVHHLDHRPHRLRLHPLVRGLRRPGPQARSGGVRRLRAGGGIRRVREDPPSGGTDRGAAAGQAGVARDGGHRVLGVARGVVVVAGVLALLAGPIADAFDEPAVAPLLMRSAPSSWCRSRARPTSRSCSGSSATGRWRRRSVVSNVAGGAAALAAAARRVGRVEPRGAARRDGGGGDRDGLARLPVDARQASSPRCFATSPASAPA